MEWDYSGRKGSDGQKKKISKANEKKRKVKRGKDGEANGQGGKRGVPWPHMGLQLVETVPHYMSIWATADHGTMLSRQSAHIVINLAVGCTFHQAHSYLTSQRTSQPCSQYHIILLANSGTYAQSCYVKVEQPGLNPEPLNHQSNAIQCHADHQL